MSTSAQEMGALTHVPHRYGESQNGLPLEFYQPVSGPSDILVMGSIHGDESLSTVLLSECLRSLAPADLHSTVILAANPDGVLQGTRCNARGVDLNRNFPTENWSPEPVFYRNRPGEPQNIPLSPGEAAGSEAETQALIKLIESRPPRLIISIHGYLDCIDDPDASAIARDLATRSGMELVPDVGYATPGSFGSWCKEKDIPIITYELPSLDMGQLKQIHRPILLDLINGHYQDRLG